MRVSKTREIKKITVELKQEKLPRSLNSYQFL